MKQLPLATVVALVLFILAWNLSFYGDLYRSSATGRSAQEGDLLVRVASGGAGGEAMLESPGGNDPRPHEAGSRNPVDHVTSHRSESETPMERTPVEEPFVAHYPGGQIKSQGTLVDGKREGRWEEFWENGQLLMGGSFHLGERTGEWIFHYEDGSLRSKGEYVGGLRDGMWYSYHPDQNLQLRSDGAYSAEEGGERVGLWTQYYTSGEVMSQGTYKRGVMQGHWTFKNPEGSEGPRSGYYTDGVLQK